MKKVLAIITGIGYGHSIREAALLNHLKENGYDIIVAGYRNSKEYFEKKFETLEIKGMSFPERKFKFSNLRVILQNITLPLKFLSNYIKLRRVCKIFQPDIIISDLEPIAFSLKKDIPHFFIFNYNQEIYKKFANEHKKKFKFLATLYNNIYKKAEKRNYPVIVPSLSQKKVSNHIHYISPIIRELPEKEQEQYENHIIIALGGSYFGSEILDQLLHILPSINEKFLIFSYKTIGKDKENIKFIPFKENFLEYLKASKAIICLGGHNTISEAVVLKKPLLVFPVPNYIEQMLNAYEIDKLDLGVSKVLNYPLQEEEIKTALNNFLKKIPELKESLTHSNIKPNGVEEAFKIIDTFSK
jgi:UDP-N-acetylglucosamine--N-acetylmuramyl-(pentapeptide) pyrophosphoryl-undecaprenol N-acetylglucosamine transferase